MTIFSLRRHSRGLGLSPRRARHASGGSTGDTEAPSVPQNLIATAVSSSQINLTWTTSTDNVAVTGYNIYRDNALVDTSPTNSYADTGLAPGTEYDYEVSAFDTASNESARSGPASATTQSLAEAAIAALAPDAWYKFDDGAGTQVVDHSGNGHHGTNSGGYSWGATGLTYDGTTGITTFDNAGVAGATPLTLLVAYTPVTAHRFSGGWDTPGNSAGTELSARANSPGTTLITDHGAGSETITINVTGTTPRLLMGRMTGTNFNTFSWKRDGDAAVAATASVNMNLSGNLVLGVGVDSTVFANITVHYALTWARAISDTEYTTARNAIRDLLAPRGVTLP
jgi:chitodextrinase